MRGVKLVTKKCIIIRAHGWRGGGESAQEGGKAVRDLVLGDCDSVRALLKVCHGHDGVVMLQPSLAVIEGRHRARGNILHTVITPPTVRSTGQLPAPPTQE